MDNQVENKAFFDNVQDLKTFIKYNNGVPVYLVEDNQDTIVKLTIAGVEHIGSLKKVYTDLKANPITCKDTPDTPVIILSSPNNTEATKVYDLLTGGNITTYRQDLRTFKPITVSGQQAVKTEIVNQYRDNYSVGGNISEFTDVIKSNVNTPAIPTGFEILDKVIDGGLYEGLYTLGAISSLGKTTFCLNVADQIAKAGHDVIILSLEMSKYQIISRSISRLTFCRHLNDDSVLYDWCKTSRGITDGSRYANYCPEELDLIEQARKQYATTVGQHLFIREAVGDMTVEQASNIIKEHIEYTGNRPVVIVDYLQLLQHKDKYINGNDKLRTDVNITTLKRTSRDYKVPIVLISSLNRMNYQNPINFEAFKESGAIEYSSDVVLGLQLAGVGGQDFDVNKAKSQDPRQIELVILKNREGKIGQKIKYSYYPMFNHFFEDYLVKD